jgi:hypothetical protein
MIWQSLVDLGVIVAIPAFVLSIITSYSLYWNPGKIEIYMPDEVGLNLNQSPSLQIYTTFSNNGSPNKWKIIRDINATGWIHYSKSDEEIKFDWRYVFHFISREDYEHNYSALNQAIPNDAEFYTIFESAKAPFIVPGEGTVSKLLKLISFKKIPNFSEQFTIEIEIKATTMDNNIYTSPKISYYGDGSDAVNITTRPGHFVLIHRAK